MPGDIFLEISSTCIIRFTLFAKSQTFKFPNSLVVHLLFKDIQLRVSQGKDETLRNSTSELFRCDRWPLTLHFWLRLLKYDSNHRVA